MDALNAANTDSMDLDAADADTMDALDARDAELMEKNGDILVMDVDAEAAIVSTKLKL